MIRDFHLDIHVLYTVFKLEKIYNGIFVEAE